MAYILSKVGQSFNVPVHIYEADTEEDMKDINIQEAPMGSRCYVINTGAWYVLNDKSEWKIVPKKEGGGGGQGAALPEMGEVTKGMYLTNDGSNAEWEAIDIPQSDWEQTDESAADYVKNRPFGNFAYHSIYFFVNQGNPELEENSPGFDAISGVVGEKPARIEANGNIYCQGKAVTVLDYINGGVIITFTSDDNLNELVFSGQYGNLTSLIINKSNINWNTGVTYSLFIDGLDYNIYKKLSRDSVEGTLPQTNLDDYILVSDIYGSWNATPVENINPIFQLSGAFAGQIVKITAVDESGKPTAWEAVDMPTGGADSSLGITGAQIEQIAKITAVDETGKPTAWEPMDIPSGGSDISLGLTAATVGQAIKVKAVDIDGKPTAWESVTPETWNFVMADGTKVTKKVYVDANE